MKKVPTSTYTEERATTIFEFYNPSRTLSVGFSLKDAFIVFRIVRGLQDENFDCSNVTHDLSVHLWNDVALTESKLCRHVTVTLDGECLLNEAGVNELIIFQKGLNFTDLRCIIMLPCCERFSGPYLMHLVLV